MNLSLAVALALCVATLVYLVYSLVFPEKF